MGMEDHIRKECTETMETCEVEGCGFTAKRGAQDSWTNHMQSSQHNHFRLLFSVMREQAHVISSQSQAMKMQAKKIHELELFQNRIKSIPAVDHATRSITWTLDNFNSFWEQDIDFVSPELRFDCASNLQHRYSFMLKLEFNAKSHVGVLLIPRPGTNTETLEWPIKRIVSISILPQVQTAKPITWNCDSESFFEFYKAHAPPAPDNLAAWGFPKFLKTKAAISGEYVHDDKLTFELVLE
jgi:hypothetical protein